jgi:virulence-associated protein VapD
MKSTSEPPHYYEVSLSLPEYLIGGVYTRIRQRLGAVNFNRVQGSVYQRANTLAPDAWVQMLALREVEPLGVVATVIKAVQVFHIPLPVMIASEPMRHISHS